MSDFPHQPQPVATTIAGSVTRLWWLRRRRWLFLLTLVLVIAGVGFWYWLPTPAPVIVYEDRPPLALAGTPVPQPQAPITAATLGQLTELAQIRSNFPSQSALSHNGRWLAMLAQNGVTIYDSLTFQPVRHLPMRYAARFAQMVIADDGQTVVVADRYAWHLWLPSGELRELPGLSDETDSWVNGLALAPGDVQIAATFGNGAFLHWRVRDGALLQQGSVDGALLAYRDGNRRTQALLLADGYGRLQYRIGNQTILDRAGVGAAITTDGTRLLTIANGGLLQLYDAQKGDLLTMVQGPDTGEAIPAGVAISDDGALIAGAWGHTINLWRVLDETLLYTLPFTQTLAALRFVPEANALVAVAATDLQETGLVRRWDLTNGQLAQELVLRAGSVRDVTIAPDHTMLTVTLETELALGWEERWQLPDNRPVATSPLTNTLRNQTSLWRWANPGTLVQTADGLVAWWPAMGQPEPAGQQLAAGERSPDGQWLVAGGKERLRLWRTSDGIVQDLPLPANAGTIGMIGFTPDSSLLVAELADGVLQRWRLPSLMALPPLQLPHDGYIGLLGLLFTSDGATLITLDSDNRLLTWVGADGAQGRPWCTAASAAAAKDSDQLYHLALAPDGRHIALGTKYGSVLLCDSATNRVVQHWESGDDPIATLAFSPDGTQVAAGTNDSRVYLWQVADGALVHQFDSHFKVHQLHFAATEPRLTIITTKGIATDYQLSSGQLLTPTLLWQDDLDLRLPGNVGLTYAYGDQLQSWDLTTGALQQTLVMGESLMAALAMNQAQTLLAAANGEKVYLWQLPTLQPIQTFARQPNGGNRRLLRFTPDSQTLLLGDDRNLMRWDLTTNTLAYAIPIDHLERLAFSPATDLFVGRTSEGDLEFHRLSDGALLQTVAAHLYYLTALRFSNDGLLLAAGEFGGATYLWGVP